MPLQLPEFMVTPPCMELKPSLVVTNRSGVFCREPISIDSKFGPFVGEIITKDELDKKEKDIDFRYAWHVLDSNTNQTLHVVNATNPEKGNWMRYVNSARFYEEQNIVSVQEGNEIFYQALKDIKPGEELLTWFETTNKKSRKRKQESRSISVLTTERKGSTETNPPQGDLVGNGKRLRKKKVSEDMVPLDHDDVIFASSGHHHNRIRNNASSGNTRRRCASVPAGKVTSSAKVGTQKNGAPAAVSKSVASVQPMSKMQTSASHNTVSTSQQTNATGSGDLFRMSSGVQFSQPRQTPPMKRPKTILQIVDFLKSSKEQSNGSHDTKDRASPQSSTNGKPLVGFMGPSRPKQKRSSLVGTAEYMEEHMNTNFQFLFRVIASHKTVPRTAPKRKRYTCDICENLYRKALSLKRHVLREHLNQKYLSEEDIAVLDHKTAMSTARIEADVDPDADDMDASDSSSDGNSPRVRPEGSEQDESLLLKEEMMKNETHAAATVDAANSSFDGNSVAQEVSGKEAKAKLNRTAIEESLMSKPLEGRKTFSYGGIDGVTDAFRCHLCVQLFPSVVKLKHHLTHDAHRSKGDKQFGCDRCNQRFRFRHNYQRHMESHGSQISELSTACHICGKKFLNEANMRKHLRFHSGRNFPCKYGCKDVVYPNVAGLVKHLRAVHPDLPKRSQAPLPDMGSKTSTEPQKGKDMTASNNSVHPVVEPVQFKTEEEAIMEFKALHPAGWTETRGRKPPKDIAGDICPICKKKFSTYGSMCRHRRSVHRVVKMSGQFVKMLPAPPSTVPLKAEEESPAWEDSANSRSVHIEAGVEKIYEDLEKEQAERESSDFGFDFSPPPSPASYYRNVADNIADNLSNFLDGGSEALKNAHQHIIVDGYVPLDEAEEIQVDHANFQWSTYNFPRFFSPTDPVVPLPPPPPAGPSSDQKGAFLSLEGDISLAYPTRSAVAEREATRRGSVGTSDGHNLGEKERMPRRASFGSLCKQNKDECKLVRRASVGSFENQQGTGFPVGRVSTKVVERRSQIDSSDSGHQKRNEKSEKMGQSDEVFDSPVHVNSVNSKNSLFAQSLESEGLLQSGTSETNEDEEEKIEGVASSKTVDQNQTKDEESSTSVTDSSTCQNVCQSKKVVNPQGSVVSPSHEPACAISEECDNLIAKTDSAVVPPGSVVENSNVTSSDSNTLTKGLVKDLADDTSQCAESRRCQPSSSTGDTLVVESTASGTMETREGGAEKIDEAWSLSVKGINDAPVNGHKNNVCEKPAVTVKEHPDKNTDQNGVQLDTSKDSVSKSEHLPPTMISKAADNTASTCAEAQPSNDLSEKELEYLSKGIILYVRKEKKPCPHVTDTATVPARSVESKDEEEYLKKLQLAAKKVKVPTTVTSTDTTDDKKISASENGNAPKPTAGSRRASGEGGQDQNEACKENDDSFPVNSPDLKARTDDLTDQNRKAPEEMEKPSEKKDQQSSSSSDLLLSQPVMADDDSQSQSDALMSRPADGEQDSSVDCELFDLQTKFRLQALQERVAIDREAEEICRRCQPDNTEFGEPSKRTAEDFAKMRFGRKSTVFFVCSLCRRYFYGVESLLRHQVKKHPSIQCSYFEVENGHSLEMLFYPEPSSRGVLAESVLLPPQYINQESYTCTRCNLTFKQYSRLRAHILNCDPNTPTTPHTRKKRPKANRHRFMEKMLPDTSPSSSTGSKVGKASEQSGAVRNLSFRPKSQGTVMGLRAKSFPSTSRNYRLLHQGSTKKDDAKSSSSAPIGRLPSTRVKTQNWKYSPPRFSATSSKLSISPVKAGRPQRRRNHEMRYNPAAHVRRREKTECVDIHQCQGCRLSFRTLSLLERHTKNCSGKEKLLSQTPVANKLLDGQEDKKHGCHYCPKRFKYLKGVYNHYINFCHVRSERISGEGLSQEDQAHEEQLQASLQQQAWNKMENRDHTDVIQGRACLHDDGTITHTRHKGGWPRGQKRSNKRRRNGWTYIKRRKPDGNTSESSSSPSKSRSASSLVSSVRSSGSATSAAMSELEARLREPIGAETKRKRFAKELEQHSECHSAQESKGANKLQPASEPEGSTSKAKKSKLDDDLSQAPVIDRMDTDPPVQPREGKQMSPDLEPPILSPIPPVVPQDSLQTKKKRKPKRKAVEPTAQKDANQTTKSLNPVPSAMQDKPPVVLSPSKKEKNGEETSSVAASSAVVAAQVNLGEGMTAPVYVVEHLVDATGKKAAQYTLVHLKVPTVVSKESGQTEPHNSAGRDNVVTSNSSLKSAGVSSVNVGTMVPKSLPPNFLFPPPEGSSDQNTKPHREEDIKVGHRSATSEPDKKAVTGKSQDTPELATAKRKSRQTKKKVQDLPATVSIKTMFKKKKSPTRTKYADTLKNMEAYHFEKETVTCGASSLPASVKVTTTCVNNTAIVNTTATLSSPLTSTAASVNTPVTSSTSPISSCVPSLPPGSGLAMLPPGAFLAVLPNPPILLQSPTGSSLTSQPTSPVRSTPATVTLPLQTAVSEGKVLFLDKSGLSSLLAPSSRPVATSTLSVASSGKGGAKGSEQSQTKISVAQFKTLLAIKNSRMSQQSKKELDEKNDMTVKAAVDIPNFLYDTTKSAEPSSTIQVSPSQDCSSNQNDEKESLPKKTPGKAKGKGKKPKRGPPPSSNSPYCGSKVKSMTMMTSPGNHTLVSLSVPSTSTATVEGTGDPQHAAGKGSNAVADSSAETSCNTSPKRTWLSLSSIQPNLSEQGQPAKEGSDQSTADDSVKKATRAAKRKQPSSTGDGEEKSAEKAEVVTSPVTRADKVCDTKTVVLNVPVLEKRGGKRNTATTRNAARKSVDAPSCNVRGKRTSASTSSAAEKSSPGPTAKGSSAPSSEVPVKARGKLSAASAGQARGKPNSASASEVTSDDDMPLSAVAAKIKDQ